MSLDNNKTPVYVNVYNLLPVNWFLHLFGFGAFHSGLEVYGKEFFFGGDSESKRSSRGIMSMKPGDIHGLTTEDEETSVTFRESLLIGHTRLSRDQVAEILNELENEFRVEDYNLLENNCNDFVDRFAWELCGERIPLWVNSLASKVALCLPFIVTLCRNEQKTRRQKAA